MTGEIPPFEDVVTPYVEEIDFDQETYEPYLTEGVLELRARLIANEDDPMYEKGDKITFYHFKIFLNTDEKNGKSDSFEIELANAPDRYERAWRTPGNGRTITLNIGHAAYLNLAEYSEIQHDYLREQMMKQYVLLYLDEGKYDVFGEGFADLEPQEAADKVIKNGYSLHSNYRELFMQDNGATCSGDEFIFAIDYDTNNARSWGGTTTLSSGAFNDDMNTMLSAYLGATLPEGGAAPYVSAEVWNGYHINPDFVTANFEMADADFTAAGCTLGYNAAASDKRIMLCNMGTAAAVFASDKSDTGWKCWKWAKISSDGTVIPRGGDDNPDWKFSSADFAIFRLPEMYYIYAEADARLNNGTTTDATALGYIKQIRDRAGLATPASMTVAAILKDKAVEYLWEGQRRQDEIRLGIFDANPDRYVYPILESDRSANPNLEQNKGY